MSHGEVQNALKRLGHAKLCLHAEETDMLKELNGDVLKRIRRIHWLDQHQWLYDANVLLLLDVRRTADASRLGEGFRAKEPSVDPTRQVNMCVFCAEVFIVNWRADL